MSMLDLQRRHATVFRIRLGDKDGNRPRKLTEAIRITSANRQAVEAFVEVYGGETKPWDVQWQAYLPTTELRILVLPGQSISQFWERYRGSVCDRRCDGFQEQKSGKRCMCPEDITARVADKDACSPTTRVNVICPDVKVVGSGALVTHGLIAAETLPQSIAVAETALSRGFMVPAILRVVEHRGRNHFIVPQIEIVGVSLNALAEGGDAVAGALPHATRTPLAELEGSDTPRGFLPVPAIEVGSVAEQVAAVEVDVPPSTRANAAEPIRPSGLAPRTAQQAAEADGDLPPEPEPPPLDTRSLTESQRKKLMASLSDADVGEPERHALLDLLTGGRVVSSTELQRHELDRVLLVAEMLRDRLVTFVVDGPGGRPVVLKADDTEANVTAPVERIREWAEGERERRGATQPTLGGDG